MTTNISTCSFDLYLKSMSSYLLSADTILLLSRYFTLFFIQVFLNSLPFVSEIAFSTETDQSGKMHLYDSMDSTTEEVLKIVEILAEEEDMKVTAFGTAKGLTTLVAFALVGVAIVQPLAWGLFLGLIAGAIVASLICWDKKSVAEVIANMPRERQVRLVEQILKTGIALGKLTPRILLMGAPRSRHSTDDGVREADSDSDSRLSGEADSESSGEKTITLSDGRVVSRQELVRILKEVLVKEEGVSISK